MKILSRSVINMIGGPYNFTKVSRNSCATWVAVKGCWRAIKWQYLMYLSIITRMVSFPLDFGRASIKSIVATSQDLCGTEMGSKSPGYLTCSLLKRWQTSHSVTLTVISLAIFGHQKKVEILLSVALMPEWPPSRELCRFRKIVVRRLP